MQAGCLREYEDAGRRLAAAQQRAFVAAYATLRAAYDAWAQSLL